MGLGEIDESLVCCRVDDHIGDIAVNQAPAVRGGRDRIAVEHDVERRHVSGGGTVHLAGICQLDDVGDVQPEVAVGELDHALEPDPSNLSAKQVIHVSAIRA